MSVLLIHLESIGNRFSFLNQYFPKGFTLSTRQKVIVISVTTGIALMGILAKYMRRKKQPTNPLNKRKYVQKILTSGLRSPNGDVISLASSTRRSDRYSTTRQNSAHGVRSERGSVVSGGGTALGSSSFVGEGENRTRLTPQQLGMMGMEALETSINYWEDALASYRYREVPSGFLNVLGPEETAFCKDLEKLLECALELQQQSELLFLDERSVLYKTGGSDANRRSRSYDINEDGEAEASGGESFASAQDQVADLREFEEFSDLFADLEQLPLYQSALVQLEDGGIPCRTLRTELVRCGSDVEYLAKLHCLRLAFQHVFKNAATYAWFADTGRQILAELLIFTDKDPKEFIIGYEKMLIFLNEPENWQMIEQELSAKDVKALTFYDIVLDYIIMDAFEDLEAPPSSVTAVVQNRWLSNGFKETALTTAVWSVLKAKRRMLKFPNGFMAHFYTLLEQLSPIFAWGFLGPDENIKEICLYFKEQILGFLNDIFSFQKCRYTNVEELAADILVNIKKRVDNVTQKFYLQ